MNTDLSNKLYHDRNDLKMIIDHIEANTSEGIDGEELFKAIKQVHGHLVELSEYQVRPTPPEDAAREIEKFLNSTGADILTITDKLANRTHPTLQQSFTRMVFMFILKMAEKNYFDGRNKGAVQECRTMLNAWREKKKQEEIKVMIERGSSPERAAERAEEYIEQMYPHNYLAHI